MQQNEELYKLLMETLEVRRLAIEKYTDASLTKVA